MRFRRNKPQPRVPKWKATVDLTSPGEFTATMRLILPTSTTIKSAEFGARSFPTWDEQILDTKVFSDDEDAHVWIRHWGARFAFLCELAQEAHYEWTE